METLNEQLKSGETEAPASPNPGKRLILTMDNNDSGNVMKDHGSGEPNKISIMTDGTGMECPDKSGETCDSVPPPMNDCPISKGLEIDVKLETPEMQLQKLDSQVQSGISFPNLENLVEFRYDLINSTQFMENRTHEIVYPYTAFNLGPSNPQVFTVVEMVSHYYSQPCCMYISGEWVSSHIQIPVAQHLCVSLDDGLKRYEQVFRLDLLRSAVSAEPQSQFLQSIEHRVMRGNPSHRPRFRDIIKRSLHDILKYLTDTTFEIIISRATGRCISMDYMITNFFGDNRPGCSYELYVSPLIQHIPQPLDVALAGIHFKLTGLLYRPYLGYASILLTRAEVQLFETLSLSVYGSDRKIIAVTLDSAMARIITNPDGTSGISLMEAICYAEFGPMCSGVSVLSNNPRIMPAHHPFCNLAQNPFFNRSLSPYHGPTFQPPATPPCSSPPPFPHFLPFGLPYGCPIPPGAVIQQPITLPVILPTPFQQFPREIERQGISLGHNATSTEEPRPSSRAKKIPGQESTTKLNPHARDFYPQGYHAMVAAPFPVQVGPEEINLSQLESEPDDHVYVSSLVPYKPGTLTSAELEALNIHPVNPVGQSSSSEISMIVNHAAGGFLGQSESHCSLLDPDTSIEILTNRTPMYNQSWSDQVDIYEDDQHGIHIHHFADNSDIRGRKSHRGGQFRGGFRGGQEDPWNRARLNRGWPTSQRNRSENDGAESYSQDVRLGHGFSQRNFNQSRTHHYENERGPWGCPRGRARGRGYGFSRQQQSDYDQHRRMRNMDNPPERQMFEQNEDETAIQMKRCGQAQRDSTTTNRQVQTSDEDDGTNTNCSEKTLSYAAAAKTNVPEELIQNSTAHQGFSPSSPRPNKEEEHERFEHPGPKGRHQNWVPPGFRPSDRAQHEYNDGQEFSEQRPPYRNRNFYGKYSPRESNWNNGAHEGESAERGPPPRSGRYTPRENNWTPGESETGGPSNFTHSRGGRYPPRDRWNNGENETTEGPPNIPTHSRGGRLSTNSRGYQNPMRGGPPKSARRGAGRGGPNQQDLPTPNDFPPLNAAVSTVPIKPNREPKPETTKPTKAGPTRGTSAPRRNKKFRKFEKEGSTSSDDRKGFENYLSDVIPNVEQSRAKKEKEVEEEEKSEDDQSEDGKSDDTLEGASPEEGGNELKMIPESDALKDAQGDGKFQPDPEKELGTKAESNNEDPEDPRDKLVDNPSDATTHVNVYSECKIEPGTEAGGEPRE